MPLKSLITGIIACSVLLAAPVRAQMQMGERSGAEPQLPAGDAKEIVENSCAVCHSLTNITNSQGHTPEEWKTTLSMMLNVGAAVPPEQVQTVLDYLVKNYPPKPGPAPAEIPGNV